jgi:hypothetical protein
MVIVIKSSSLVTFGKRRRPSNSSVKYRILCNQVYGAEPDWHLAGHSEDGNSRQDDCDCQPQIPGSGTLIVPVYQVMGNLKAGVKENLCERPTKEP